MANLDTSSVRRRRIVVRRRSAALGRCVLCAGALVLVSASAGALEGSFGVGAGGMLAGSKPLFAVSPHGDVAWRLGSSFLLDIHGMLSILPATNNHGVGVYTPLSVTLGYTWETGNISLGPLLSFYSLPACNIVRSCFRVTGIAPGAHAQVEAYVTGRLGVSVSANVDWVSGSSRILHDGVAAMVVAGPVLRWGTR